MIRRMYHICLVCGLRLLGSTSVQKLQRAVARLPLSTPTASPSSCAAAPLPWPRCAWSDAQATTCSGGSTRACAATEPQSLGSPPSGDVASEGGAVAAGGLPPAPSNHSCAHNVVVGKSDNRPLNVLGSAWPGLNPIELDTLGWQVPAAGRFCRCAVVADAVGRLLPCPEGPISTHAQHPTPRTAPTIPSALTFSPSDAAGKG